MHVLAWYIQRDKDCICAVIQYYRETQKINRINTEKQVWISLTYFN